jgi:small subunit ribosomal protein S21
MIRLTDEQWERIRNHFPEEHIADGRPGRMQREGIFREMKRRKAYEKPSERKTREKAEAIRRTRKAARKQAQREGLIPMPKKRELSPRRAPPPQSF